jgi:adenosylcobinamide-GDP ribazoletransferase
LKNLLRALAFLTIIPLPFVSFEQGGKDLADSAAAFPVAGAVIGLIQALLAVFLLLILPPEPVAVLILAAGFLLTRGLHADGLADTADGLIGVTDREKSFKAMADSSIGVMGAVALLLLYLLKFTLLSSTGLLFLPLAAFFMPLAGRWAIVVAGSLSEPAFDRGLGDLFLRSLGKIQLFKASLGAVLLLSLICFILPPLAIPVAVGMVAALLLGALLARYASRRLGGLTGDILGAVSELGELVFLVFFYLGFSHGHVEAALTEVVKSFVSFF